MGKDLSSSEIAMALKKIRSKYELLVREYRKPRSLAETFEDRYIKALKARMDMGVFLMAEIEAVEILFNKEKEKKELEERTKPAEKTLSTQSNTVADKIFEENRKRILKYARVELGKDLDEEVLRLLGAVRELINVYYPAVNYIFRERRHSNEGSIFNEFSNRLIVHYDFKGPIPIAKSYVDASLRSPVDNKKLDYEHRFIIQETAFLFNEILDELTKIINKKLIPMPDAKFNIPKKLQGDPQENFYRNFNGLTFEEGMVKVQTFIQSVVYDFRIKDLKRNFR